MATYVPIQSLTLTSNTTYVTLTNIDQSYTDLRLVMTPASSSGTNGIRFRVGGSNSLDTGSNYSYTAMDGNGSTAGSYRESGVANGLVSYRLGIATSFSQSYILDFMNYSNSTTFKTVLGRYSDASQASGAGVFTWRNTGPINTISFSINTFGSSTGDFIAGSTFDLYGISHSNAKVTGASGGTAIYYDSTYAYHVFTGTGAFVPTRNLTADYLVVGGGGGGGGQGGGGGAGGLRSFTSQSLTAGTSYAVVIGAGGKGGLGGTITSDIKGGSGSNSSFASNTSAGGGGGGCLGSYASADAVKNGISGGSGGGGGSHDGYIGSAGAGNTPSTSPSQGNNGGIGAGTGGTAGGGGGGGGAGGVGADGPANRIGGNGGIGAYSTLTDAIGAATGTGVLSGGHYYFAGGGGGSGRYYSTGASGTGGLGGGGNGGVNYALSQNYDGYPGYTNTGGGGGSGASNGGNGGSGIVIVRYER